jgi:hypothetical protein
MNTVLYFELRRKRRNLLKYAVVPAVVSLMLFVVCMATDAFFPFINRTYMKWPDMVKDLLSLKPWSGDLWLNVWQLFALCYPFYLIYMMMTETAEALSEEDRLETVVYLHNAGVDRKTMFGAKLLVWAGEVFACCGSLLVLHVAFAAILRQQQGMKNAFYYYTILFLVCMLYLSIVLFMAVCRAERGVTADQVTTVLILPWLVSRIPALMRFISELLVLTGREGKLSGQLGDMGQRLEAMTVLSPLTWSWPAVSIERSYVVSGIVVFAILTGTAFSIYTHRRMG